MILSNLPTSSQHRDSPSRQTEKGSRRRAVFSFAIIVMCTFTLVRMGLFIFNGEMTGSMFATLPFILLMGFVYDLSITLWWSLPLTLLLALWPAARAPRVLRWVSVVLVFAMFLGLMFVAISEFVFWNEFSSRFNFIAVDYLIYSREVVGNIRESYNLPALLSVLAVLAAVLTTIWMWQTRVWQTPSHTLITERRFFHRVGTVAGVIVIGACTTAFTDSRWKDNLNQPQAIQLGGNGVWEFFYAFRFNEIDFEDHYQTMPWDDAVAILRSDWQKHAHYQLTNNTQMPIERVVKPQGAPSKPNIMLISMESMGAEFIESLGGKPGLTPNLAQLEREGLYFSRTYATGTRTVRGLEALTLSVPPTPGHAVPMRPNHANLFTLGGVLKRNGYDPIYMYGGYAYFDNMRSFFGGNGYTVIDRTQIE